MVNKEILNNNEITLYTIARSLDNITKTLGNFATKEDLKQFATKDDLKQFATKDDLKQFATKDDLKQFATKDDLKQFATKDDLKQFATKKDLEQFATKKDLADAFARLEYLIDSLAITTTREISKLSDRIDLLEQRFDTLEQKVDRNHAYSVNQIDNILTHYTRREEHKYHEERLKKLERKAFA